MKIFCFFHSFENKTFFKNLHQCDFQNHSRHPLSRNPMGAAKKFEIVNVRDSQKSKNKINCILHTRKYINQTCNTLRGKIETKGTLLGEKSKIA